MRGRQGRDASGGGDPRELSGSARTALGLRAEDGREYLTEPPPPGHTKEGSLRRPRLAGFAGASHSLDQCPGFLIRLTWVQIPPRPTPAGNERR
jgi:hypothetical protein